MHRAKQFGFLTMLLLVVLRLAIGWHFLFEGVHKLDSFVKGETLTSKPFSSAGYFREAPGPLAWEMRQQLGDPDDDALSRLTLSPTPGNDDTEHGKPPYERMPPGLKKDWEGYSQKFAKAYGLDDRQQAEAKVKLEQAEANFVNWLTLKVDPIRPRDDQSDKDVKAALTEVEKPAPSGNATLKQLLTPAERVQEYRKKVQEYRDMLYKEDAAFGMDVVGPKRLAVKAEAATLRKSLMSDVDKKTADVKASLDSILTPKQAGFSIPPDTAPTLLWWMDGVTAWGLTIIGGCLLIGLFSRTNCVLAAGFLLMTYLASPPFPWLPTPPNNEGNYLFVNKNLVEMFALLALATTRSGQWFGVDALIAWFVETLFGKKPPQLVPVRRAA